MHDQEVIYKNVSIEGPNGIIRSGSGASSAPTDKDDEKTDNDPAKVEGYTYKGCFRDTANDRVFRFKSKRGDMTNAV